MLIGKKIRLTPDFSFVSGKPRNRCGHGFLRRREAVMEDRKGLAYNGAVHCVCAYSGCVVAPAGKRRRYIGYLRNVNWTSQYLFPVVCDDRIDIVIRKLCPAV